MFALYINDTLYVTGLPLADAYALACRLAAEFPVTVRVTPAGEVPYGHL